MDDRLSHLDAAGRARMVDVSAKPETVREATACARVVLAPATFALVAAGDLEKGDVLQVARLAGIQAAKRTAELIPLCHPLPLTWAGVELTLDERSHAVRITATCRTRAATGVEMEALTAASVAALTVYDMCKAVERGIRIEGLRVVHKAGGASGEYREPLARGALVSVNISVEKGTTKVPIQEARLLVDRGIEGDAHAGPWHRQVSLLAEESIAPMRGRGVDLVPGVFAENLTVRGLSLFALPLGARLRVGEALLEVTQIGKECHHGCEIRRQVGDCVMPREGVFARVLVGGLVRAGDDVEVLPAGGPPDPGDDRATGR